MAGGARLLEGGPIADEIRTAVAEDVASFTAANGREPGLAVVIVGRDAPSTVYLERILRGCAKVGIHAEFVELEGEATEASVVATIRDLNADPTVDGVIVQMPLPPTIRLRSVVDAIDPAKDIDGIHPLNAGLLRLGYDGFLPATAHAAVEILRRSGIEIEGKRAVVDPGLIRGEMLRRGAVVVDVGINVVDGALVGDVDFESARRVASAITPVPGGVGPLTNALLLAHLVRAANGQAEASTATT